MKFVLLLLIFSLIQVEAAEKLEHLSREALVKLSKLEFDFRASQLQKKCSVMEQELREFFEADDKIPAEKLFGYTIEQLSARSKQFRNESPTLKLLKICLKDVQADDGEQLVRKDIKNQDNSTKNVNLENLHLEKQELIREIERTREENKLISDEKRSLLEEKALLIDELSKLREKSKLQAGDLNNPQEHKNIFRAANYLSAKDKIFFDAEINRLQHKIKDLTSELEVSQDNNRQISNENYSLSRERIFLIAEIDRLKHNIKFSAEELKNLQDHNRQISNENYSLARERIFLTNEIDQLKHKIKGSAGEPNSA